MLISGVEPISFSPVIIKVGFLIFKKFILYLSDSTNNSCAYVRGGVLSELVVFADKLFANIACKSIQDKTDLVVIDSGMGDIESFRNSWREGNF